MQKTNPEGCEYPQPSRNCLNPWLSSIGRTLTREKIGVPPHPPMQWMLITFHGATRWYFSSVFGSTPDPFKAAAGDACVMDGMSWVAVAEVILDQPEIVAPNRESETTGVPQHVRVNWRQSGARRRGPDQVIDGLAGERLAAFRDEEPGESVRTGC